MLRFPKRIYTLLRDLAARNVLLDATCTTAKIADLGLARELSDADYYRKVCSTLTYCIDTRMQTTKQQVPVRCKSVMVLHRNTNIHRDATRSTRVPHILCEI